MKIQLSICGWKRSERAEMILTFRFSEEVEQWVAWRAWGLNFRFQSAEQEEEFQECFHFLIEHLFSRWYT